MHILFMFVLFDKMEEVLAIQMITHSNGADQKLPTGEVWAPLCDLQSSHTSRQTVFESFIFIGGMN